MTAPELKPHPTNPHGVLVPCANCGHEIHAPRDDFTEGGIDPANLTCSYDCMVANQRKVRTMNTTTTKPEQYEFDAGVRLTFDTLTDRGFDPEVVAGALDGFDGDLWMDIFGPAIDRAGEAIGLSAFPEDEDDEDDKGSEQASIRRQSESREELAVEAAKATYGSDEVTIDGDGAFLTEDTEPRVESVDGGYWVAARVWVEAWDVEDRLKAKGS